MSAYIGQSTCKPPQASPSQSPRALQAQCTLEVGWRLRVKIVRTYITTYIVMKHVEVVQVAVSPPPHDSWMNTCELWLSSWSPRWAFAWCRTPRKMTLSEMFIQGQETLLMQPTQVPAATAWCFRHGWSDCFQVAWWVQMLNHHEDEDVVFSLGCWITLATHDSWMVMNSVIYWLLIFPALKIRSHREWYRYIYSYDI